ncbi:MAG: 5'-methylthioadenosine/adenosylhomocysteine nucleosidase [Lachnospiraceae bacterium]|nr:5'-methylthioadenosine/adenosylhomocysteine nucleosidase [Lachnospiraceae bacterium]
MKIGIIGAMEIEVSTLKEKMSIKKTVTKAGMDFCEGTLCGADVVVVMCGVGKVSAAMCVQILADLFEVTHVINTGVAGSLNAKLDIGDILVSVDAIQHDMDVTALGYTPGQIPGIPVLSFAADEAMRKVAVEQCKRVNPDIAVVEGRVVSGDAFISGAEKKDQLISVFQGDCAEMEGASIAQAAYLNHLPYLVLRAISDKADDSAHEDYPSFEKKAAEHCAKLVMAFAENFHA